MSSRDTILVIDDEKGIRDGCSRVLEPAGFRVDRAATLQEGRQMVEQELYDLVLLDVMMPDGRGIDLLEAIHARDADAVCVIITGYATVELAVEAIKLGAYDFISKPFTADQLLMTVNQGLEKRRLSQETRRLREVEKRAAELARLKEEMERLDQQKSAFMTMVAHELRAPLGGAQSLLRTLLRGLAGELNGQQRQMLQRIEARLDALLELVNDLLALAASKTFEADQPLQSLALMPLVQEVIQHYQVEAHSKQVRLDLESSQDSLQVMGTPDGLQRIFSNLVGNAIKYTPEGGKVQVALASCPQGVEARISDTGIGIPAADQPRLFEEFFRARNAKQSSITGTGLGLSIVKQLVDHFGGQITFQSQEGRGTTFLLTLHAPN